MQFQRKDEPKKKAAQMVWDGTEKRAGEISNWARDEALIAHAAVTPPDRNAAEGTPAAGWQLKILAPVSAELGGGVVWEPVPLGATIRFTGTEVDPVFTVYAPRLAAEASTAQGES